MKYIKEYNDDEVSKIDELSDYLQELFDKHHIVEVEEKYVNLLFERHDGPFWYIHIVKDGYFAVDAQIIIRNIVEISTLQEDILKIIPNIEIRLGQKVNIWFAPREYAILGIKNNYIKEWTEEWGFQDEVKPNSEDRLRWVDKEIKRLMDLANGMDEGESKDLLLLKMSELLDERDELRSEDGSLPPIEEEPKSSPAYDLNTKTGKYDTSFSETLPPVKPTTYYSYYRKKTRDELASDTPTFENIEYKGYVEISSLQDQQNAVDSAINISDDTLSKLDKTFKSKIISEIRKSHLSGDKILPHRVGIIKSGTTTHDTINITILELRDEWFFVVVLKHYDPFDKDWSYYRTYKCDQIEGLIQLLKKYVA